jgi:RNA polymerase sigma factor (sigma-70 family)
MRLACSDPISIAIAPDDPTPANDREARILGALEANDHRAALKEIERLYGDAVYRYVRAMVPSDDSAHDVWQNTFLQAYRDLKSFARRSSVKTWLYKIARHRCLDELRAKRRHAKHFLLVPVHMDKEDEAQTADKKLSDKERMNALERCVAALAPEARAAVLLRYVEGFSYQDMAEISGERAETLRARVSRALPVLKKCVEREGV